MAFCGETEAFRQLQKLLGASTVQLVDTYDTLEGARRSRPWAGRCGACASTAATSIALSREVRAILDEAGLHDAKIMVSGDLDEYRIRDLVAARRAQSTPSAWARNWPPRRDAPSMGAIYKLVELDVGCGIKRFTAKLSRGQDHAARRQAALPL